MSPKKRVNPRKAPRKATVQGVSMRKALVDELYKRAQPTGASDPRTVGGSMTGLDLADSHARNSVVLDMTDAVLMEGMSVAEVETYRNGVPGGQVAFIQIDGRINKTDRHVSLAVVANTDAVAAFITELLALASRSGAEYLDDLTRRLTELHQGKDVDLPWLRAAIDNAMELDEELT